jgi:hypothetical protein
MKQFFAFPAAILFPLLLLLGLSACDIIEAPYYEEDFINQLPADEKCLLEAAKEEAFPEGVPITKKVLLEEMTGHKCGNCPEATETAYRLYKETYPDQVILVGLHAGPLASFTPTASKYFTDFTTPDGDEIYETMNPGGVVPFGMVDREVRNTNANAWPNAVAERLQVPPVAGIRVVNCYEIDSVQVGTVIDLKFLEDISKETYLNVWLIEDKVIDWQKDYRAPGGKVDLEDYEHHQVFRQAINSPFGEPISGEEGIKAGDRFRFSYSFELSPDFDPAHCKVVAFVYDFESKVIGQVEQRPLL